MIKTNATGLDLQRGLVEDGIVRPPKTTFTRQEKFLIAVENSLPDGVWLMNAKTREGVIKHLRLLAATER